MVANRQRPRAYRQGVTFKGQRGFVLVLVLVMLTLITFTMTRLGSQGLKQVQLAATEERSMQHRWRTLSIGRLATRRAPELLRRMETDNTLSKVGSRDDRVYQSSIEFFAKIGSHLYQVRISDESAKIPLGELLENFNADAVIDATQELVPPNLAYRAIAPGESVRRPYDYSQVFDAKIEGQLAASEIGQLANERFALWGPGMLGLERCDPEAIDALWRILFKRPAPTRLHELRLEPQTPRDLIAQLGLRESDAALANRWFSSRSNHHSIWIVPVPANVEPTKFCVEWGTEPYIMHHSIEY